MVVLGRFRSLVSSIIPENIRKLLVSLCFQGYRKRTGVQNGLIMTAQPAFTSSKLTIETIEQDVKYVNNKNARITPGVVLMSLLLTLLTMSLMLQILF